MMSDTKFQNRYRIASNRLKGYDYSLGGAYFITICTIGQKHTIGKIINGKFSSNNTSDIIRTAWMDLPNHYNNCVLDEFVMMPNHIHGIIIISYPSKDNVERGLKPLSTGDMPKIRQYPLSEMIRGFKTFSTRRINEKYETLGKPFWQKNYYDRIIRNEFEFEKVREYIYYNPLRWQWNSGNFENFILNRARP